MYLGVPILHGRVRRQHFQYLGDRVGQKLSGWKCRLFSAASRLLLIQLVCAALPTYTMNVCCLPRSVDEALERIHRQFFWGDLNDYRTTHIVGLEQVCQHRHVGGLGLRPIRKCNDVLLAKLAWRFSTQKRNTMETAYASEVWGC